MLKYIAYSRAERAYISMESNGDEVKQMQEQTKQEQMQEQTKQEQMQEQTKQEQMQEQTKQEQTMPKPPKIRRAILHLLNTLIALCVVGVILFLNTMFKADATAQEVLARYTQKSENGITALTTKVGGVTVTAFRHDRITGTGEDGVADTGIIFYPGARVEADAYAPLAAALAESGFTVLLVDMPLNIALLNSDAAEDVCDYAPEVEKWYIAGHSLGGAVAAMYLDDHPENWEGLILLASYSTEDLTDTDLNCISIYGDRDGVLNMKRYESSLANLPSGYQEHIIEGGNHAQFGSYGSQPGDNTPTISAEEQLRQTVDSIVNGVSAKP